MEKHLPLGNSVELIGAVSHMEGEAFLPHLPREMGKMTVKCGFKWKVILGFSPGSQPQLPLSS